MDNMKLQPNEVVLVVVETYDEGIGKLAVTARRQNKREWHYFCFTKPVLVDFNDILILNCRNFDVFSYRNPHLKYRLQKCELPESLLHDMMSSREMDLEYETYWEDGYLRKDDIG